LGFDNLGFLAQALLPDGLHPNAAGMDVMAGCLEAAIEPLMRVDADAADLGMAAGAGGSGAVDPLMHAGTDARSAGSDARDGAGATLQR
jgi:hypothetical protein